MTPASTLSHMLGSAHREGPQKESSAKGSAGLSSHTWGTPNSLHMLHGGGVRIHPDLRTYEGLS